MSLHLQSNDQALNRLITEIMSDETVTLQEFRDIRDQSDAILDAEKATSPAIASILSDFQTQADALTDTLQKIALTIRKNKVDMPAFENIKKAIEYQLTYLVMAYASSVERYSVLKTGVNTMADKAAALKRGNDQRLDAEYGSSGSGKASGAAPDTDKR
ncbi:hypothetical protein [Pseudomonas sp. UBA6562]|uniref:hypothetical protein n=1 Tax=Pseudomonas sp. UBA6562 TaxID=1947332 RepID=UPI0025CFB5AC|nr:hypothetical protein [Pseudomonas sp. UBA6562]